MINELTPKQEALLAVYRERWLKIGLSTEPANRKLAERGVAQSYRIAGLKPPATYIWLDSPIVGCIASAILAQVGDQVRAQVRAQVGDQVWAQVRAQVGAQVRAQVWTQVGDQVWAQVGAQVGDQVRAQVGAQVNESIWGSHLSYWCGWAQYFDKVLKIKGTEESRGLSQACCHAGWWWAFENVAVLTERPSLLKRDEQNRLHSQTGMALRYPDGWGLHVWHGTRVPGEWIESPERVDASLALTWKNIEQRRALAEIVGWDKVLEKLNTKTIDKDRDPHIGELLEVDLPDSPRERFLRVLCGTGRTFALPVGKEFNTAIEAQSAVRRIPEHVLRKYEVIS